MTCSSLKSTIVTCVIATESEHRMGSSTATSIALVRRRSSRARPDVLRYTSSKSTHPLTTETTLRVSYHMSGMIRIGRMFTMNSLDSSV
uniref:Uncharacterized protein n=1 Tax=Anopheles atroparvus TaxID=41427 RepID=A0AAG5CXU3_ANOAO